MINQKPEAAVKPVSTKGQKSSAESKSMSMDGHALRQNNNGSMNYTAVQDKLANEDVKKINGKKYKYGRYE